MLLTPSGIQNGIVPYPSAHAPPELGGGEGGGDGGGGGGSVHVVTSGVPGAPGVYCTSASLRSIGQASGTLNENAVIGTAVPFPSVVVGMMSCAEYGDVPHSP